MMTPSDFIRLLQSPRLLDNSTLEQLSSLLNEHPYCQSLRMLHIKNLHKCNKQEYQRVLNETAALFPDRKKLYLLIHQHEEKTVFNQTVTTAYSLEHLIDKDEHQETTIFSDNNYESKDEIIQRFITSGGRINPALANEHQEEEEDRIDLHTDTDFITESLAEIFIRKGKYKEAIKIYEKLTLKYPEKFTYFASQIEKLNKLS